MIEQWKLCNFKSIHSEAELEIAPLTIFCGANSSGKSTFLQSILLIAQTLTHKIDSPSVVLNGAMVRLGRFDDLKSNDSKADQCVISWKCKTPSPSQEEDLGSDSAQRYFRRLPFYRKENPSSYACEISIAAEDFQSQEEINQIQPILSKAKISVLSDNKTEEENGDFITIERIQSKESYDQKTKKLEGTDETLSSGLPYDVGLDENSSEETLEEMDVQAIAVGCVLHHFLPRQLVLKVDKVDTDANLIVNAFADSRRRFPRFNSDQQDVELPEQIARMIFDVDREIAKGIAVSEERTSRQTLEKSLGFPKSQPVLLKNLERQVIRKGRTYFTKIIEELAKRDFKNKVLQAVKTDRSEEEPWLVHASIPRNIREACRYFDYFFSTSVRYLGPLRDEPKVLYPLLTTADPSDIGLKGEYTAAVLELHKEREIRYVPSSEFAGHETELHSTKSSLKAAVDDWLHYLDIAESVETKDLGKLGHELKVQILGRQNRHDLTNVGVGVSQVLPILVTGLLANFDTTLVFEQPELHLHPKVQTLLADFFLSLTRLGKQCLIETHSEHLINRIRLRIANASRKENPWDDAVRIYFVERTDRGSSFRPVHINEYGAITDWPEGFFDQSHREAEEILLAATRKRRARREIHGRS